MIRPMIALAAVLTLAAPPVAAQQLGLRGTVVDSATNTSLQGVRVQASAPHGDAVAWTDERGRFRIAVADSGAIALVLTRIGYSPRRLEVRAGAARPALDVAMVALGLPLDPVIVTASRHGALAFGAPAAVSVVDREQIGERVALGIAEHVRTTPGMDMASKGLIQHAYAARGERGSVSGALLTLTDFRYAELPALALNIPYLVPAGEDDLERIEIVRGPGAALYGPGADRGVLHYITRSPFESPGASVSVTAGGQSLVQVGARWAGLLGRRAAFKLSGDYLQGTDWPYEDSVEAFKHDSLLQAGADPDTLRVGRREPQVARASGEARLDWRPTTHTELITTAGFADAIKAVDLGGDVGSVQARNWQYRFVQARLREGDLHVNLFYDASSTGDSYLLRTGSTVVDDSRVLAGQLQHGARLGPVDLLYGADLRWTDPRTGGTINGDNEGHDQMTETGAYLHGTTALGRHTDFVGALRVDHHDRLNDLVVSPRLGMVYRPSIAHAFRLTFNRGFSSPDANSLFGDLVYASSPPYAVRAGSVPKGGYTFDRSCGGLCMHTPFGPAGPQPIDATVVWPTLFGGIPAPAPGQVATYLRPLDSPTPVTQAEVTDIAALRRTITTGVEFGWKAAFGRRFGVTLDVYANRISDVRGSRYVATPNAYVDSASMATYLRNFMSPGQADAAAGPASRIPIGTVSPRETTHPTDMLLLSHQGGQYTFWGVDLGLDLPLSQRLTTRGSFSWLSRDSATVSSVPGSYVLGVPRQKAALGLTWRDPGTGREIGAEGRLVATFPVNTGVYVGTVKGYGVLDVHGALPVGRRTTLMLQVNNALDNRHQEFVGAPALGRLFLVRLRSEL